MSESGGTTTRLVALDGLRGLAALQVVIFHAMLVNVPLANAINDGTRVTGWLALWTYTPLRLLWSGQEAVLVFFVLSGVVLTLPFRQRPFDAVSFYPRRLLRIYLPVWGSVLVALLWTVIIPRTSSAGASWWLNGHAAPVTVMGLGGDATLVIGTTWLNSVLWSLKWEVWFSLLLPLYLLVLVRHRRWPALKLAVLLAATQIGAVYHLDTLRYLPVFGVGVLLATRLDDVARVLARLGRLAWIVLVVSLLVLVEASWLTGFFVSVATVLAAAVLVALFAHWRPTVALGKHRIVHQLGTLSFSLYLVHEPVVTSAALLLETTNPLLVLAVALPISLVLAWVFYRIVERPSHRLAQALGRATALRQSRSRILRAGSPT